MLNFWKSNSNTSITTANSSEIIHEDSDYSDDDEDSYFEIQLTSPSPDSSKFLSKNNYEDQQKETKSLKKPQSPISILRSASPKLPVFMFGRLAKFSTRTRTRDNVRVEDFSETDSVSSSCYSPKRLSNDSNSSFSVKFKVEDGSIVPKFTRSPSNSSNSTVDTDVSLETSKRFSKDTVQKYLNNLIKPKSSSIKCNNGDGLEKQSSRFKVICRQLGKSKSALSVIGVSSPVNFPVRNDLPADSIEGAILHCKRSLTSSNKGYSSLSRCSSDPSHEKSIQVSEEI